jgi:radical SAM protein with 4Fe4S-binding SPASM domain
MDHKNPKGVELVCKRHCPFYKPGTKEDMACQGLKALQSFIEAHPKSIAHFPSKKNNPFKDRYHHILHQTLCQHCDFFIDGCDFTDPEHTGHPLPCGGYIAVDLFLSGSSRAGDQLLKSLFPREAYVALDPNCTLKHLETPYLYDIRDDELYELDQGGFEFLKKCDGTHLLSGLSVDKDFLETCLKEQLLVIEPQKSHRRLLLRQSPIPSLRYLELQLTSRCNLTCKHCYLGEPTKAALSLPQVMSVLEEFERMQGLRVLFSGGEPLLYPHLKALNDALPRFALRKVLLTNGTLVREENFPAWCHFDEIQFSLDGLKKGHEALRGRGTFEQTMAGIRAAQDKGIPISIATMVHRYNLTEFETLARWIADLQAVEWSIDVPCATGRLAENTGLLVTPEQGGPFLKYATGGSYHGADEPFACGYHLCTITAKGRILKCGFFDESPLGSLKEGLEVSWKRARHLPLTELECASCPHLSDCKGGCRFRAESPLGKDPVMCALYALQSTK